MEAVRSEVRRLREAGAIREAFFSRMVGEYRGGKEKEWQIKGLRRFHRIKLGMPKRPIPNAEDRSVGRCYIWTPENELFGCLSGVSLDCPGP